MAKPTRRPPSIYQLGIPTAQERAAKLVHHAIWNLEYFSDCFAADLQLFDFCQRQHKKLKSQKFRHWQFVAARDGVINIWNFHKSQNALGQSLDQCRVLKEMVDAKKLRHATKYFNRLFSNCENLRNSLCHAGEKTRRVEVFDAHQYTGQFRFGTRNTAVSDFSAIDSLVGRTYTNTWNKKVESYRMCAGTLKSLLEIRDQVWDVFDEAISKHTD